MNELVSVVIPIYNAEKFLENCIESVIKQTYPNLEIILINDGSTDSSLLMAEQFEKKDKRVRVFSQKNEGLIAARKKGVELANGKFIGFVDSDDWIEKDMYENLVNCISEFDCDLVSSGIFHDYESGRREECYDIYQQGLYTNLTEDIIPTMLYDDYNDDMGLKCTLVNKLFRKNLLSKVYQNIDTRVFYGEDALTIYQYCLQCSSIYILRKSFYHYYIRNGSMCRKASEELTKNTFYLYSGLKNAFMNRKDTFSLMKQLKQYVLQLESHTLKMLFDIDVLALANWDFSKYDKVLGKQIVLYGAGSCGQAFYQKLVQSGYKKTLVAWVDKNVNGKAEQCLYDILPVKHIVYLSYEYIVIAIKNEDIATEIKKDLIRDYGISNEKIIWEPSSYKKIF